MQLENKFSSPHFAKVLEAWLLPNKTQSRSNNIFARHRQRNAGLAAMRVAFSDSLADSSIFRDGSFHYLVWVFGPLPALRLLPRPEDFLF